VRYFCGEDAAGLVDRALYGEEGEEEEDEGEEDEDDEDDP
jgi:hypothetical protein